MPSSSQAPTVVLVGGGHAHVEILRRLAEEEHPPLRAILVSPEPVHHYSGMAPGYIAGLYREAQLTFDLAELARRVEAEMVLARVEAVDATLHRLRLVAGRSAEGGSVPEWLPYDLVSFDIGSQPAGVATPGFAEYALPVKPLSRALEVRRRLLELAAVRGPERPCHVVVVGAGAAGVEVALAAARTLDDAGATRRLTLLEAGPCILAAYDEAFRRRARRALDEHRIEVRLATAVAALEEGEVVLEGGGPGEARGVPSDLTLWLTGPAAAPLFRDSGLPVDERGYLLVDETLRALGHSRIFASGDCATPASHPDTPKAGVYAVRQAPVLWRSLTLAAAGADPAAAGVSYQPQQGFLSLLNTCDGKALFSWKGFSFRARWAWWLKDWIDRRFMRRYRTPSR